MAYGQAMRERYVELRKSGHSKRSAANTLGINEKTAARWESGGMAINHNWIESSRQAKLPGPKDISALIPQAARALGDFAYWRFRYLGRRSTPWQEEAGQLAVDWLLSPDTELAVVNCPPGSGKSTLFTCDIPAWMICRDRAIRIIIGRATATGAAEYSQRLRTLLGRTTPLKADPAKGRIYDAEACLGIDYGRFKPEMEEIWRREMFTVQSGTGEPADDKEPTVAAYGMNSGFLGERAELVIWDDLVTGAVLKSEDQIEAQRKWWDEEGETRVEPGGCLILQGQRMGSEDLYRYALDQKSGTEVLDEDDLDDDELAEALAEQERLGELRYRHIIFPAHFEDRCEGVHSKKNAKPYPEGCLLDPVRIPWRGRNSLTAIQRNRAEKFRVQYQQEDVDPANTLVDKIWVSGGTKDGIEYPGCWDNHRGAWEVPIGLSYPWYMIASADPSPTKYWAIEVWLYHPASEQRFLIDLLRQQMDAPDFLDWNENNKKFFGIMEDWQQMSIDIGYPISHWIIENNAAQRFLLQYDHVKRWQRLRNVNIVPHSTGLNKLDPEFGIQMLANRYKFGNVRLPGKNVRDIHKMKDPGRNAANKLIDEATKYPDSKTDDCLMAQWFFEYNLETLSKETKPIPKLRRPSWMRVPA